MDIIKIYNSPLVLASATPVAIEKEQREGERGIVERGKWRMYGDDYHIRESINSLYVGMVPTCSLALYKQNGLKLMNATVLNLFRHISVSTNDYIPDSTLRIHKIPKVTYRKLQKCQFSIFFSSSSVRQTYHKIGTCTHLYF